jgi:hypothetical protein
MEARSKRTYGSSKVAMRLAFSVDERAELGTTAQVPTGSQAIVL